MKIVHDTARARGDDAGMLTGFDHADWLAAARRVRAIGDIEPEDLLQDAILVAIRSGRTEFRSSETRRWFTGVLRNVARQSARATRRRSARELSSAAIEKPGATEVDIDLDTLSPTNRQLATLLLAGMTRAEIVQALGTNDAAFRQRLVVLRRAVKCPSGTSDAGRTRLRADARLPTGLIRLALIHALSRLATAHAVGTHDPDGHPIVLVRRKS